jgi:hypothetical protein
MRRAERISLPTGPAPVRVGRVIGPDPVNAGGHPWSNSPSRTP